MAETHTPNISAKTPHWQSQKCRKSPPQPPVRVTRSALTQVKNLNVQTPRERKSKERADLDDQDSQPLVSHFNTQAYVGWPKPKKRGDPQMTPADFKMVLGFDRDTNRAYQALRSELIVYMKGLGIDSHNRA